MTHKPLIYLAWLFRVLALLVLLGGIALTLIAAQADALMQQIVIERGMTPASSGPGLLALLVGVLVLSLVLVTTAETLMGLARIVGHTARAADALERIRGRK